jgi:transcriptional regulator with XRE-family HTH domain
LAKPANRSHSRYTREAAELLGLMIHNARMERGMTLAELAERAGVSRSLAHRAENGNLGCAIGAVFELASIVGVPLFEAETTALSQHLSVARDKRALLPKSARRRTQDVMDEF